MSKYRNLCSKKIFFVAQQPKSGLGCMIVRVPRSHTLTQ